jgi:hypothetical protein
MQASFYRGAEGVVFFKLAKPPISGSGLTYEVELVAEEGHKKAYPQAWKEFEKPEEIAVVNVEASKSVAIGDQGKKK